MAARRRCSIATIVLLAATMARAHDVALLRPTQYLLDHPTAAGEVHEYLQTARDLLATVGVRHHTVEESALVTGSVPPREFLICAYNPDMPREVGRALEAFLGRGGSALLCYFCPEPFRQRLGLGELVYTPAGEQGRFRYLSARPSAVPGMPELVRQDSWNAYVPATLDPSRAVVLMDWVPRDGAPPTGPALVADDRVAWLGHVLTPADATSKACLLLSLAARQRPHLWDRASDFLLRPECDFRYARDMGDLQRLSQGRPSERSVRQTVAALNALRTRRRDRPPWSICWRALQLRERLADLYVASLPARRDSRRGAWVVMPEGVGDWGWDKTARVARENGLTDLFVRVEWGGRASYPSQVLRSRIEPGEDPVAEGLAACHRYGLRYHAWFINLNWRTPPAEIVAEMSARGLWQISPEGEERINEGGERVYWLNPAEPGVVALQRDMMAEVAREYAVDGVHFDYIRYENYSGSYGARDRASFERWAGTQVAQWPADVLPAQGERAAGTLHERFCEWRWEQVSRVVEAAAEGVRAVNPRCELSAAVYPSWPYHRKMVGQDWPRWLDEGWLDFVCPMVYDAPAYSDRHQDRVARLREAAGAHELVVGLGAWLHPTPVTVAESVVSDRELGADGFVLFSYTADLGDHVLPALRRGVFADETAAGH